MDYVTLQNRVLGRLNLTSTTARDRVKDEINTRLREIQSSVGMAQTRFGSVNFVTTSGSSTVTASGIAKLGTLYDPTILKAPLNETTVERIRALNPDGSVVGPVTDYAVEQIVDDSVTLLLYPVPTSAQTLKSDCLLAGVDLVADSDVPTIPVDFHDVIVRAVLYDELAKMEKMAPLALAELKNYTDRMGDLRLYLAKSAYLSRRSTDNRDGWLFGGRFWPYSSLAA